MFRTQVILLDCGEIQHTLILLARETRLDHLLTADVVPTWLICLAGNTQQGSGKIFIPGLGHMKVLFQEDTEIPVLRMPGSNRINFQDQEASGSSQILGGEIFFNFGIIGTTFNAFKTFQ